MAVSAASALARALGESPAQGEPPWAVLWRAFAGAVQAGPKNANNRFELADRLNRAAYDADGHFWGRPPNERTAPSGPPITKPKGG